MDKELVIKNTSNFVRETLDEEISGHDWWHIYRVTELTKEIALKEGADLFICTMASLLHDIADEKLNETEEIGIKKVKTWLLSQDVDRDLSAEIMNIITTISFKGGHGPSLQGMEAKIVQDADRIDAIGAIGIARCFVYSGSTGELIHNPQEKPREKMTKEEYRKGSGTAINHFYEKLLKLKEQMNTETGKKLAIERHKFMEKFLDQFYEEWEGNR